MDWDFNFFVEMGNCSEETITLITGIWGKNEQVFNDLLFYFYGYRDWEQYCENEDLKD